MTKRISLALALALVLAGCSKPAATPAADPAAPVSQPPTSTVVPAAQEPVQAADRDAAPAPAAATKLALDGEGLRIVAVSTGSTRALPFGTAKADALSTLSAVEGAPPVRQGENIDCGATNAIWPDGLTVWFASDKFVGWSVGIAGSSLSTMGGLKLGSTRTEVENGATVATIAPSSLGEEFTAGGVAGLLESKSADAKVTNLWAGSVCIAR